MTRVDSFSVELITGRFDCDPGYCTPAPTAYAVTINIRTNDLGFIERLRAYIANGSPPRAPVPELVSSAPALPPGPMVHDGEFEEESR